MIKKKLEPILELDPDLGLLIRTGPRPNKIGSELVLDPELEPSFRNNFGSRSNLFTAHNQLVYIPNQYALKSM